jgi:integrase
VAPTDLLYTYKAKGKYWRFRHPLVGDVALPRVKGLPVEEQPRQAAFMEKYAEHLKTVETRAAVPPPRRDSFTWLIKQYRASEEFKSLADATQLDYGNTLKIIDEELGDQPFALTTRAMIKAVRDDYAATPRKAHKIKQMTSRLYSWSEGEDLVAEGFNPASRVKRLKRKGGTREYAVWSQTEFEAFMAGAIVPMQTAAMIARYTGQRARDIVKMVWTDFQGDMIRVRQHKTGTPLMIACHRELRTYLDDLKRRRSGVMILTSVAGEPYNANSLSSAIGRDVARLAKVEKMPTGRSIHGLRYMAGSDMEEAGCTVSEIESVLGHQTFKMALKYASQRLRAKSAINKMEAANGPA